ncbi:hypothetical protein D910_07693 [Dendroctonus ponderosae]|uniref:C2H2-type domain-containing protein n=1 Tax=Dendroctonus ponderosae TaxID=77166 RepID=U4U8X8_DENPD|nr:hypothetical protein D910_07693 [Dendroctonus ponderosae]
MVIGPSQSKTLMVVACILSTEVYIHVKEEITIEECHLSQYEDLRRLEADDHQTLDLKHKGTLSTIRNLRENVTYTVTEIHIRRKNISSVRFQMDSFTEVKEEITIDEHDLTTYDTLELDADNDSTCNVETQNTVMQSNPCSKPNRDSLHLKEHLFTHPGERSHACEVSSGNVTAQHRSKHTKETMYVCKSCYQGFVYPTSRHTYAVTHSNEQHACDLCSSTFKRRRHLQVQRNKHVKNKVELQNEWYIPIKEEITIDEHDLLEVQNLEIKADERRTLNTKDQKTSKNVLCCKICSQPCGGLLELNEHLLTHPQERTHGCDFSIETRILKNATFVRNRLSGVPMYSFKQEPIQMTALFSSHESKQELEVRRKKQAKEKHYDCEICHKSFLTMTSLLRHEVVHSDSRPFECDFCKQTFKSKQFLQAHRNTHTKEKYYECEFCHKRFLSAQVLWNHKIVHSDQRPFECDICKKTFKAKGSLQVHRNTHTKEKHYECEVCQKRFLLSQVLQNHKIVHSDQRPFECDICKQTFKAKRLQNEWYIPIKEEITIDEHDLLEVQNLEIKADERRTLNTKDQKTSKNVLCCKICSQPCGGLLELNEHLLTHPQERTHGCDKQFKWDSDVLIHARTHSDDRPFVCDFCSSPHQSKHELEVRRNRQAKEKHYNCEICHKSFLTMTSFLRHEVVHSEYRPFECDFCEQTFKSKQFLQAHRNTHTKEKYYECEVCHERFLSSQVLCNHKIVHSDHRPFECDICKKTFKEKRSLQVHRNTHTKEKRYECEDHQKIQKDEQESS